MRWQKYINQEPKGTFLDKVLKVLQDEIDTAHLSYEHIRPFVGELHPAAQTERRSVRDSATRWTNKLIEILDFFNVQCLKYLRQKQEWSAIKIMYKEDTLLGDTWDTELNFIDKEARR